jgi:hypothetical protein
VLFAALSRQTILRVRTHRACLENRKPLVPSGKAPDGAREGACAPREETPPDGIRCHLVTAWWLATAQANRNSENSLSALSPFLVAT